jgi:hypothetical protein
MKFDEVDADGQERYSERECAPTYAERRDATSDEETREGGAGRRVTHWPTPVGPGRWAYGWMLKDEAPAWLRKRNAQINKEMARLMAKC